MGQTCGCRNGTQVGSLRAYFQCAPVTQCGLRLTAKSDRRLWQPGKLHRSKYFLVCYVFYFITNGSHEEGHHKLLMPISRKNFSQLLLLGLQRFANCRYYSNVFAIDWAHLVKGAERRREDRENAEKTFFLLLFWKILPAPDSVLWFTILVTTLPTQSHICDNISHSSSSTALFFIYARWQKVCVRCQESNLIFHGHAEAPGRFASVRWSICWRFIIHRTTPSACRLIDVYRAW